MKKTLISFAILGLTFATDDNELFMDGVKAKVENQLGQFADNHQKAIEGAINTSVGAAEHLERNLEKVDAYFHPNQFFMDGAKANAENKLGQFADNHQQAIEGAINTGVGAAEKLERNLEKVDAYFHPKQDQDNQLFLDGTKANVENKLGQFADNHQQAIEGAINTSVGAAEKLERNLEKVDAYFHPKQDQDNQLFLDGAKAKLENHLENFANNHQKAIEGAINTSVGAAMNLERNLEKVDSYVHGKSSNYVAQVAAMMNDEDDELNFKTEIKKDAEKVGHFYENHEGAINDAVKTGVELGKILGNENDQFYVITGVIDYLSIDNNLSSLKGLENEVKETPTYVPVKKNFLGF